MVLFRARHNQGCCFDPDPPARLQTSPEVQKIPLSSGGEVAVRTAGDASKPALVLLHGFRHSSRTFRDAIAPLSGSVYVVAPDLPGFGGSDLPSELSFDMLASSVEELLSRLNVVIADASTCARPIWRCSAFHSCAAKRWRTRIGVNDDEYPDRQSAVQHADILD
jgi:hypothetical protein